MRIKLVKIRKKRGLTQNEMAKRLQIARTTYAGYENGYFSPSLEMAIKIKKILKYKNDDIFLISNVSETNKNDLIKKGECYGRKNKKDC